MRRLAALFALGLLLSGCSGGAEAKNPAPESISSADVESLLLTKDEVNTVMGTRSMTPQELGTEPEDNSNLLANLNCLGVWQVGEVKIYGPANEPAGWDAMRVQRLRTPDVDDWDSLAVQSVVAYPSAADAQSFFAQSADRWSKCTGHTINITLNDRKLPSWLSGELARTDTRLSMPIARGAGADVKQCQHVLEVVSNVILDVQTCKPKNEGANEAGKIVDEMKSKLPTQ